MRNEDRTRIAEAFAVNNELGDILWKNWSHTEFSILLIDSSYEFLVNHPEPTADFISTRYDSLLKSDVYYRPRQYQENFLATFPAVNNIPTVVVGIPEKTNKSSAEWIITLLHEHFHQYQMSQPDYYDSVNSLNLSHGDVSGMWMLNYDFPYEVDSANAAFNELCSAIIDAISLIDSTNFLAKAMGYYEERKKFTGMLKEDDYKYFSFQLWQEGIARYTELKIALLAADKYRPSGELQGIKDFITFKDAAQKIYNGIIKNLKESTLASYKRVAFYYLGAGEALLLDKLNHAWKEKYFTNKFYIENYLNK